MARPASPHFKSSGKRNGIREYWAQGAFSPVDLLNLWEPTGAWEEYPALRYGAGPRQKLDVYKPRHAAKAPVLVFLQELPGHWRANVPSRRCLIPTTSPARLRTSISSFCT